MKSGIISTAYKGVPSQLADVAASQPAETGEDKGTLLQIIFCFVPHECLEFGNFEECPFVFLNRQFAL